mmetsp:Transcript_42217/g.90067  ORF Transcript_42217/g.90067 Transcript_42217/m.90067 type:complete len:230 (-) Transcript_42217:247-936(-)
MMTSSTLGRSRPRAMLGEATSTQGALFSAGGACPSGVALVESNFSLSDVAPRSPLCCSSRTSGSTLRPSDVKSSASAGEYVSSASWIAASVFSCSVSSTTSSSVAGSETARPPAAEAGEAAAPVDDGARACASPPSNAVGLVSTSTDAGADAVERPGSAVRTPSDGRGRVTACSFRPQSRASSRRSGLPTVAEAHSSWIWWPARSRSSSSNTEAGRGCEMRVCFSRYVA